MGLTSALQLGTTALNASQLAVQVVGNNLANAATPGYARQIARLTPMRSDGAGGLSVGTGVRVQEVRRQIDEALQARLWAGLSHEAAADQRFSILAGVESTLDALGENSLSSGLTSFFASWSEKANNTQSNAAVVERGAQLADRIRRLRSDLAAHRDQIDRQLALHADRADALLTQIADVNRAIAESEGSGGKANSLRDQRDQLLTELSDQLDITVVEQPGGAADILVGSTPIVLGANSRGVELRRRTINGELRVDLAVRADGQPLPVDEGRLGAMLAARDTAVDQTIRTLDQTAAQLIFQVNRLHSTGANKTGLKTAAGTLAIPTADRALAFNDPQNATFRDLPFAPATGSFQVIVKNPATGATTTTQIGVDLDGITAAGTPGFADDATPEDIRASLDAVPGLTATFAPDGTLKLTAAPGLEFSFADDDSGVLAVLGVNSFFTGKDAADIAVRSALQENPALLMSGRMIDGQFVENGTALEIAGLQERALAELGGRSLSGAWLDAAQRVGIAADGAQARAQAATIVRQSLEAQHAGVSGVSIDEESVNLITYQRQYQGAARFISIVDELTRTLISLV